MNDLFGIIRLGVQGQNDLIGDDVVHKLCSCGAGKSKIVHLDRRRAKSKDAWPRVPVIALQIYSDVDAKIVKESRDVPVALSWHVEKLIECCHETSLHFAIIIGTERYPNHLKSVSIMQLEQLGREICRRMTPKISREVCDHDLLVAPDCTAP